MRINVNLASRPFADLGPVKYRLRIAMGVMVALSLLFGLGLHLLHHKAEEVRVRAQSVDRQLATIAQEREGYENLMREPGNAQLLSQVGVLNQLIDEKTFSWTLAMQDLETVLPAGVQVTTLEPIREKDGTITLRLRVVGPRDRAVDLVKSLERSKRFLFPRIVGEAAENAGGPGERLEPLSASNRFNFDLQAQFNPATADELKKTAETEAPKAEKQARAGAHQAALRKPANIRPKMKWSLPRETVQMRRPRNSAKEVRNEPTHA